MPRQRVAVIGSGISGLACAYWLGEHHDVTVFEQHGRLGGHVDTHELVVEGEQVSVDSGFIVFNRGTYPLFCGLLRELGVESQATDMSFGVSDDREAWEFCGRDGLRGILSQPRNLLRPRFLALMRDIVRFGKVGRRALDSGTLSEEIIIGDFLTRHHFGSRFREAYLIPFGASIWSADPEHFLEYPAASLLRFFSNHGILEFRERPTWETIVGGSQRYVERLESSGRFTARTHCIVSSIQRTSDGVLVLQGGQSERFDQVVIATPAPTALRLLQDPDPLEQEILAAFATIANQVTIHTDTSVMPRSSKAWGAWNYHRHRDLGSQATLSYWMNLLQRLSITTPIFVTLNQDHDIDSARVLQRRIYEHPVFNPAALQAQDRWNEINGDRRTWFAGAYWFNGFHEDGARSARRVADALGSA